MQENYIINIENLTKEYRLGVIGAGTLREDLQSWWAKVRKKEDPNTKIGAKTYSKNEKFCAVKNINLAIKKGEVIGIIGKNGAGKSTLLKLLSRITAPTKGTITIRGKVSSMLEIGAGFHPEMTGRENIYLNGAILGMTKKEVDSKIEDIIDFSECREFIDTPAKRYSSGMIVKLAFSVSAFLDSDILIMDEVLAVGDVKFQEKCIDKMNAVATNENKTILYVSHSMNTIKQLCSRCVVLDKGEIVYDGEVDKAIGIYTENIKPLQAKGAFTVEDKDERANGKVNITGYEILNGNGCKFNGKTPLKLALDYCCENDVKDVYFRAIFQADNGARIGTANTKPLSFTKTDNSRKVFLLDLSNLIPAEYNIKITICKKNTNGGQEFIQVIRKGFNIVIVNDAERFSFGWNNRAWGNVCLKDIEEVDE